MDAGGFAKVSAGWPQKLSARVVARRAVHLGGAQGGRPQRPHRAGPLAGPNRQVSAGLRQGSGGGQQGCRAGSAEEAGALGSA
eukprot:3260786-Pyramimonas_sp.AAC.1